MIADIISVASICSTLQTIDWIRENYKGLKQKKALNNQRSVRLVDNKGLHSMDFSGITGYLIGDYYAQAYKFLDENVDQIIFYHGTHKKFFEDITTKGLLPPKKTGNNNWERRLKSNPEKVYFGYPKTALCLTRNAFEVDIEIMEGEIYVLRAIVDVKDLDADGDSRKNNWYESMIRCNTCAIKGGIPPENILGYYIEHQDDYHQLRQDPDNLLHRKKKRLNWLQKTGFSLAQI